MYLWLMLVLFGPGCASTPTAAMGYDGFFTGKTLRFDYYHTGTASEEHIALDKIRLEGEWPGSRTQLLDETNFGKYLFELRDTATNRTIYSRGFCSVYGEWETIEEAKKGVWRAFHESQRFPEPRRESQLVLRKRAADGSFREIYSSTFDPTGRFVDRSPIAPRGEAWSVFQSGAPSQKVDFLVLAEGYTAAEKEKFHKDVKRMTDAMFATEPYKSRKGDFNFWAIDLASAQSGISNPRKAEWRDSPLGLSFNSFDIDRYVLTYANETIREIAAQAPYDALVIVYNGRKYGGGGIYNLYATVGADTAVADYVFVHEIGHSFGGLADEYYSSEVAYQDFTPPGTEPWEPNATALRDPVKLKWKDLVEASTPLPTPWDQSGYDRISVEHQAIRKKLTAEGRPEEEMESLFDKVKSDTGPMLAKEKFSGKVGAFEGAAYEAKGLYRPYADCIMFTRNPSWFCPVCERAISRVIDLYAK